jgi:hypothetical protein
MKNSLLEFIKQLSIGSLLRNGLKMGTLCMSFNLETAANIHYREFSFLMNASLHYRMPRSLLECVVSAIVAGINKVPLSCFDNQL